MILSLVLALLSGALCAAVVCKAIHLRLWLDAAAALGASAALWAAAQLAGAVTWPLFGLPLGFLAVVVALKLKIRQQRS